MELNHQVNDLVDDQQKDVDKIEENVEEAKDNIDKGTNILLSMRKSPTTYAMIGGLGLAAVGGPALLIGAGVKAAIGGIVGFGTIGAFGGSWYAKKSNDNADKQSETYDDKKEELLKNDENIIDDKQENDIKNDKSERNKHRGFQTKPRKRKNQKKQKNDIKRMNNYNYNYDDNDDDDDGLDAWDARN